jgi:hypothetical protein
MKLVFQRDIPELKHKSWRQRRALYRQAGARDKRILIRSTLTNLFFVPVFSMLMMLLKKGQLPSFLWVVVLYLTIGIPIVFLLHAWWVNPLIKDAIQSIQAEGPTETTLDEQCKADNSHW